MGSIALSPDTGVIVTGGASGIGRACAEALAEAGRPVACWDLDGEGAAAVGTALADRLGVASIGIGIDVTDTGAYGAAIDESRAALGTIGGLVHAAGTVRSEPVDTMSDADWDVVLDVNLRAGAMLVRALVPDLRSNPGSAIVGIASIEAVVGHPAIPSYVASKHGLVGLMKSVAARLGADGIRANAVCPGFIETPMLAPALSVPGATEAMVARASIARIGQPRDIGCAVRFLMSDDASFITGTQLIVDGGVTSRDGP